MTDPTPTRDEAVPSGWKLVPVEPTPEMYIKGGSAMMDARHNAETAADEACACYAAMLDSAPAPASGGVDAVGVCGISADTESKRVLKLHFKHEVTDADRKTIIDAFNTLNRERRSALSPAATPVSEAEPVGRGDLIDGLDDLARRMPASADKLLLSEAIGLIQSLAKPASSPAGGDVDIEAHALKALMKAIQRAEDGAGTLPAKEAVKLRPTDWHAVCDRARKLAALSPSTSAGRVGE